MDHPDYKYICRQLAKSISSTVRVYENGNLLYDYSVWKIKPDPVAPYLDEILHPKSAYGVITTPLFQFYAFLDIHKKYRFVIGPSGLISTDKKKIDELMLELGVPKEKYSSYAHTLRCPPVGSLENTISMLKMLAYTLDGEKMETADVFLNEKTSENKSISKHGEINSNTIDNRTIKNKTLDNTSEADDTEESNMGIEQAYSLELMLMEMIRNGEVEKIEEINESHPVLKTGAMAYDTLRQMKNEGICGATLAARAAIEGGIDCTIAFQMSDIFIQKTELMTNYSSLRKLQWNLFMDYAVRVQEAKRLLKNTNHSLTEIAYYLAFSSQSHFQNIFKKSTGQTPAKYRAETRRKKK